MTVQNYSTDSILHTASSLNCQAVIVHDTKLVICHQVCPLTDMRIGNFLKRNEERDTSHKRMGTFFFKFNRLD